MKTAHGIFIVLIACFFVISGCAPKSGEIVVLEVGDSKVTLAEYENFFTRNSGGWEAGTKSTLEERERFLDLLTNYKLKLQDTKDNNMMNDSDVVKEISDYRASLASTFMLDRDLTDPGVEKMYERKKEEIRAKHILLKIMPNAAPEETIKVYSKAMELIQQLKNGENFDSVAIRHSEDPSVKTNAGDVYWFTGGQMVGPFEDAAFSMKPGEISSLPARSSFGYHIIMLVDRQPVRGSIKVSHIMTRFQTSASDSVDTLAALSRINGIQDSLRKGLDFHQLAVRLSEDGGSAPNGGDLGWFERRRFVQPFDEAAFKLKEGENSGVVRTPFGYHLIHCDSVKPFSSVSEEKMREELRKLYKQTRYTEDYNRYIERLKSEFNFSLKESTFNDFIASLDSTKTTDDSAWAEQTPASVREQALISLNNKQIVLDSVITLLTGRPEYRDIPLRASEMRKQIDRMVNSFLLDEKSQGLEERSPEFASLMNEYKDGIVLYKAEQTEVWNKVSVSDTALKEFYESNKSRFTFPDRVNIVALLFETDTLAFLVYDSLKGGADFKELAARYREVPPPKTEDGSRGLQPDSTDELTRFAAGMGIGEISEPIHLEDGLSAIIKLVGKEPARGKTFEEAGAEISNVYQEHTSKQLEKGWLDRVKARHQVIQHKEKLLKAFTDVRAGK